METTTSYKNRFEKKNQRLDIRLDESMIQRLKEIRKETGISVSELCREAVRRLIKDVSDSDGINLNIN